MILMMMLRGEAGVPWGCCCLPPQGPLTGGMDAILLTLHTGDIAFRIARKLERQSLGGLGKVMVGGSTTPTDKSSEVWVTDINPSMLGVGKDRAKAQGLDQLSSGRTVCLPACVEFFDKREEEGGVYLYPRPPPPPPPLVSCARFLCPTVDVSPSPVAGGRGGIKGLVKTDIVA